MKRLNFRKVIALLFSMTLLSSSFTGCSKFTGESAEDYDHIQMLSYSQVQKQNAEAFKFDNLIKPSVVVNSEYNWEDVSTEKSSQLKELVENCEGVLKQSQYEADNDLKKLIPKDTYKYIKATIDGYALSNGTIVDTKGSLGYYYVDVQYDIKPQSTGKFKENVDMLGLNGTWKSNTDGSYSISDSFLGTAVYRLNKYFLDNRMPYEAAYQSTSGLLSIYEANTKALVRKDSNNMPDEIIEEQTESVEDTTESVAETIVETVEATNESGEVVLDADGNPTYEEVVQEVTQETTEAKEEETTEKYVEVENNNTMALDLNPDANREPLLPGQIKEGRENSIVSIDRKAKLDIDFVNNVVGSSLEQAYLPDLSLVYTIPKPDGDICGYGIYPEGINGLRAFGYNRDELNGKLTIRYIFKDTLKNNGEYGGMIGCDIYVKDIEIYNGINRASEDNEVASFIQDKLQGAVDRSDRIMANCDLPGFIAGNVYEDIGYGVLRGFKQQSTNQLVYMSTIRNVLQRDTTNNLYLLDVETLVQDGSKAADKYATFKEKYYVVVQQQGEDFVISDSVRYSRETVVEPVLDPDSATQKRLLALNLAGKIDDDTKVQLSELLSNLYTAVNARELRGKIFAQSIGDQEWADDATVDYGVYDCFNEDETMVTLNDFLDMTSTLTDSTLRKGGGTPSTMVGRPTEWIGGSPTQAEFLTAEFIEYEGFDEAYYAKVYYLVSNTKGRWVIDERRVIEEVMVSDAEGTKAQYKEYATNSQAAKPNAVVSDDTNADNSVSEDNAVADENADANAVDDAGADENADAGNPDDAGTEE